jgi:hypothetical protein
MRRCPISWIWLALTGDVAMHPDMFPSLQRIITHSGTAHKDEWLACSMLLAQSAVPIIRRDPTESDLRDASTAVVDVGGVHDPLLMNFDHHQFPGDHEALCSLTLVLDWMKLLEAARDAFEWMSALEWIDSKGPVEAARHYEMPYKALRSLASPIDQWALRQFSQREVHFPGEPVWEMMRSVGAELLGHLRAFRERSQALATYSQLWTVQLPDGDPATILFLPRGTAFDQVPSLALHAFAEKQHPLVVGLVYPDTRGNGYAITRFNDHPCFDFRKIQELEDVMFAHARGFLAKTTALAPDRLRALMQMAMAGA